MISRVFSAAIVVSLAACGGNENKSSVESGSVGGDVVARAGGMPVTKEMVRDVALAQRVAPSAALDLLVDDAIFASRARAESGHPEDSTAWSSRALLARDVIRRTRDEADANRLPFDDEVKSLSAAHWVTFDRGETVTVIHVVVLRPKGTKSTEIEQQVASAVHDAVVAAKSPEEFEAFANAVPPRGKSVRVERLPPFVIDGRIAIEGVSSSMDASFSRAAFDLHAIGDTSRVIETPFGWHVIRLISRAPPMSVPWEERRTALKSEAYGVRAQNALDAQVAAMKAASPVEISPAADELMGSVTPRE